MLEHMTPRARRAVVDAQAIARAFRAPSVENVHLLEALLLALNADGRRVDVTTFHGSVVHSPLRDDVGIDSAPQPPIPFSTAAKEAIANSVQIAADRHDHLLDAGHLVLALLTESSTTRNLLGSADVEKIRNRAESQLGGVLPHEPPA